MVPWYQNGTLVPLVVGGVVVVSNEVQLKVRVPEELKDMVDADGRTNKAVVQSALWSEFGGRKKSALEAKKQHKADQLEAIEASIESDQKEKRRVLDEIRSIEAQIERMEDVDERYRQDLDSLLDQLEDGDLNRIVPALCEDVAEDHGKDPSTVFEDCKRARPGARARPTQQPIHEPR